MDLHTDVRHLLNLPGRSEVTAVETEAGETLLTAILHSATPGVTGLIGALVAIADQYPSAALEYIEPLPLGGWALDFVSPTP
jgi:hypothetical protein